MALRQKNYVENNVEQEFEEESKVANLNLADNEDNEVFNMLAGYVDEGGVTHTEFTLREMTGKDEEAISKSDVRSNPAKLVSILLARCVTRIGSITPANIGIFKWQDLIKNLLVGDQDYMMVQLRAKSISEELSFENTCPSCHTKLNTTVNYQELEIVPFKGIRKIEFNLPQGYKDKKGVIHKEGIMRLATGFDRELLVPIARNNISKADTVMLTRLCTFNDGLPVDEDIMASLTVKDRKYLQELMKENMFGLNFDIDVTCSNCGESFKSTLNSLNFI